MYSTVNAGVIGVGHMGQYHVAAYSEIPGVKLAGVSDVDKEKGKAVAEKYRTTFYEDYRELLDKVDVLTIAVPTKKHFPIAMVCLEAGKHCLVEKPICDTLENAERLFDMAAKKNVALHVGHVERFNGAVQELRKVVKDPILIESRRLGPFNPRVQEDGVVLDLMIHDIDIIMNIVNSPVASLNVIGSSVMSQREDVVNVQIQFESGCMANIIASRATQEKIRTLAITQRDEYVVLDYTSQDILVHRRASSQSELTRQQLKYRQESLIERIFVHRDNPLKLELKHLIGCGTNGDKRIISVENELQSLKVALQVLAKLKPVTIKSTP
ncbi:MAG: Gfo/Idh/MocA family oxidoreductase [Nitrospinota bacterium]|nr:Gfo/Idh/MocA family oxidoreductase [Nitrospinota bacterium]MDH5677175.1 Gfo/Idh/MocA family oxidoreductase [Nitrospinota bacterium]MDH5755429.1 Gfo/Idh/MocA family oxidoreductase [Nitrospinota bacterium]